ncbi:MAG: zinc ribbon domain-containing protein [Alistipes sp.]|nr:zinc ribbon domain-containing protein [Alistipes sp.]
MARFCTECGEALTEPMMRCPRCGSAIVCREGNEASMVRNATILLSTIIVLTTMFAWYSMHLNIDGGGAMDAAANIITRILPGYSGISTVYGRVTFALALVIIVAAVCRRRVVAFVAALGCVVTAIVAMVAMPDFLSLNAVSEGDGATITDMLNGPMGYMTDGGSDSLREVAMAIEVGSSFVVVDICYGLYMMLVASVATTAVTLYDVVRMLLSRRKDNKTEA